MHFVSVWLAIVCVRVFENGLLVIYRKSNALLALLLALSCLRNTIGGVLLTCWLPLFFIT